MIFFILFMFLSIVIETYQSDKNKKFTLILNLGLLISIIILIYPIQLPLFYILTYTCLFKFFMHQFYEPSHAYLFIAIYLICFILLLYLQFTTQQTDLIAVLSVIITILAVSNQTMIRKSYEDKMNEYQNKILTQQVNEVQNIYLTMRGWRHDYHNHLQAVKAYLNKQEFDIALNYLNKLETDLDQIRQLVETGNVHLDAILNSKLSLALKQDIDVNFKANVPEHLTVSELDLCIILGNLIDNAMEACEKMQSNRFIRLYIGIYHQQLYISLTNSTNEVIRKLDEEYITHKRGNHGHGLKRINNTVEKYDGFINRKNEPGVFVTEIMLPL